MCRVSPTPSRGCPETTLLPDNKGRKVTVVDACEEGEGLEKGSIADDERGSGASINLDFINKGFRSDHLPPQTVFVRVLRELEDDFTAYSYKGYESIRSLSVHRAGRSKRSIYTELTNLWTPPSTL